VTTVRDSPADRRYEIVDEDRVLGFAAYQKTDELVVFTHTEVEPALAGRGIGSQLVRGALDHVRTLGLSVLPVCPFVQDWMARNPEYAELDYRRPESHVTD
jgi:predicted GNAT family acetyltransferase